MLKEFNSNNIAYQHVDGEYVSKYKKTCFV